MDHKQFEEICRLLKERKDDIRPSDVVIFPEPLRSTLSLAVRVGRISLNEMAKRLDLNLKHTRQLADLLMARNLFRLSPFSSQQEIFYETRLSAMTRPIARPSFDLWKKIDEDK